MDPARAGCQELGTAQFLCAAWREKPPRISPKIVEHNARSRKKYSLQREEGC